MKSKSYQIPLLLTLGSCVSFAIAGYCSSVDWNKLNAQTTKQNTTTINPVDASSADITSITQQTKFDSRSLNIVTPVKIQEEEPKYRIGWAYGASDVAETNLMKQGLVTLADNPILSPTYLFYATKRRDASFNIMSINEQDVMGTGNRIGISQSSEQTYSVWAAPCYESQTPEEIEYVPPPFTMLESDIFVDSATNDVVPHLSPEEVIKRTEAMKYGIAKYGAITLDAIVQPEFLDKTGYYNNNKPDKNNNNPDEDNNNSIESSPVSARTFSVIGWDDNIKASQFSPVHAKRDGGWLIKDSYGDKVHGDMNGYFYLSYDSLFTSCIGFSFSSPNKYQNNYHWDVGEPWIGSTPFAKNENAAIFPVEKASFNNKEFLKAVGVSVVGNDVDVEISIYNNVQGVDRANPRNPNIDPTNGEPLKKIQKHYKYGGTKYIELEAPLQLNKNQYFSVVAKVSNAAGDAYISLASDPFKSVDDMTYSHVGNKWVNEHENDDNGRAVARIRAYTTEEKIAGAVSHNLDDAVIQLDKDKIQYGDGLPVPKVKQVTIGDQVLTDSDYQVIYGTPKFTKTASQVRDDNDPIGYCEITVQGNAPYTGRKIVKYKILAGVAPSLGGYGWYTENYLGVKNIINIKLNDSQTTYKDIPLPPNFYWNVGSDSIVDVKNPASISYIGSDADYYKYTEFKNNSSVQMVILHQGNVTPPVPLPPIPPVNPDHPESNLDPAFDLTKAEVEIDYPEPIRYWSKPVEPAVISVKINGKLLYKDTDYSVEYRNNNAPGNAQVIIKPAKSSKYWGQKVVDFLILNPDGTEPGKPDLEPPVDPNVFVKLEGISLSGIHKKYKVGDVLTGVAVRIPSNANPLEFNWYVNGVLQEGQHQSSFSLPLTKQHNNQMIQVEAIQEGVKKRSKPWEIIVEGGSDGIAPPTIPDKPAGGEGNKPIDPVPPTGGDGSITPSPEPSIPVELTNVTMTTNAAKKVYIDSPIYGEAVLSFKGGSEPTSGINYVWRILGDNIVLSTSDSVLFNANKEYDKKWLEVTATYNGNTVRDSIQLNIIPNPFAEQQEPNISNDSGKYIFLIAGIVGVSFTAIVIWIIVSRVKKWKERI